MTGLRNITSIVAIVLGALMIVGAIGTSWLVRDTLVEQNITIPDDGCLAGEVVDGPFDAYCQAQVIQKHTLESTDGRTYAELDREDPLRDTAMNSSFLQSSLFTSILAYGVSAMAAAVGILFVLIGLGMRDVGRRAGEL